MSPVISSAAESCSNSVATDGAALGVRRDHTKHLAKPSSLDNAYEENMMTFGWWQQQHCSDFQSGTRKTVMSRRATEEKSCSLCCACHYDFYPSHSVVDGVLRGLRHSLEDNSISSSDVKKSHIRYAWPLIVLVKLSITFVRDFLRLFPP